MTKSSQASTKENPFDEVKKGFQLDLNRGTASSATEEKNLSRPKVQMRAIDPNFIRLDENVRLEIDQESHDFQILLQSIREKGILQSLLVEERTMQDGSLDYVCVEGHRRALAARLAPLKQVPCMVKRYENSTARIEDALAADQKKFLNLVDRAEAYQQLLHAGKSPEEIGNAFKLDIRTIQRYLKIASWPQEAKVLLQSHPECFSSKDIFHNFVQKSLEGDRLIEALKQRLESKSSNAKLSRKGKTGDSAESEINSKLFLLMMKRAGVGASVRQQNSELVATLHFTPSILKTLIEQLRKTDLVGEKFKSSSLETQADET